MTTKVTFLGIFVVLLLASACDRKNDGHHDEDGVAKDWKEMDHFHMIMAEAFHPYKDSSDLQPAKEKAQELVTAAKEWKNAEAPEGVDADQMESRLEKLTSLSEDLQREVATGTDDAIAKKLTELHDLFHELQNDFYGASSGGHGDHHHEH